MRNIIALISLCVIIMITNNGFSQTGPMRIAILDLQPQGVSAQTALTVSDMLRTELFKTKLFIIIERNQMSSILKEQAFQLSGCTDTECAVQAGKLLSARKILVGTVSKLGDAYVISARIVDVEKGVMDFGESTKVESESQLDTGCATFADKLAKLINETEKSTPKTYFYPLRTIGYISAGVCLISLGAGILVNNQINKNNNQADSLYNAYENANSNVASAWNTYNDKINSINTLGKERTILYITSGVTGAFGIVSIFFIRKQVDTGVSFEISPGQLKLAYRF